MKKLLLFCVLASVASCKPSETPKPGTAGVITTIAGTGSQGFSGDGGPATIALLQHPYGVAVDASGNVYIADGSNGRIRKISTDGIITTIAGNGTVFYDGDGGPATNAALGFPIAVAVDGSGNVYFSDSYNQRVRKINTSGIISTVAGDGYGGYEGDGMAATASSLNYPSGIAIDGAGNLYIADANNNRVRKVNTAGIMTTIAGQGSAGFAGDGGQATDALLSMPSAVAVDASGNVYIADNGNRCVRKVDPAGKISTVAGMPGYGNYNEINTGPATAAYFTIINALAMDADGNLYVADESRIRKINTVGAITTLVGDKYQVGFSGDGAFAIYAKLNAPNGIAVDSRGVIYIADRDNHRIRKVGK